MAGFEAIVMRWFKAHLKPQPLVVGCFRWLSLHASRQPKRMIVIATLITLAAAPGILRLKLRTDGHALVSPTAPEVLADRAVRDHFGLRDQLVVLIRPRHADGIFNPATLQLVRDLTAAFQQLPGVAPADVMSLATEPSFRLRSGRLVQQTLLEPALGTKPELDRLRDDLRRIELYNGTLVSGDGRSTVILVGVPSGADRTQFYAQVLRIITSKQTAADEIALTGAPVAEALFGIQILADLGVPAGVLGAGATTGAEGKLPASVHELRGFVARHIGLVPLAALVMMLVLLLCFRNVLAALLPLPGVLATMLLVFGLMGWLGVPIYLTTAVMPVLLTVISVTNDIYLFSRYFNLLRENPGVNHAALVGETFDQLTRPVACTSLAAMAGFMSFGFSPLAPVQMFGLFTGIGALLGMFLSFTVVPALLVLIPPAWLRPLRRRGQTLPRTGSRRNLPAPARRSCSGAGGWLAARWPSWRSHPLACADWSCKTVGRTDLTRRANSGGSRSRSTKTFSGCTCCIFPSRRPGRSGEKSRRRPSTVPTSRCPPCWWATRH